MKLQEIGHFAAYHQEEYCFPLNPSKITYFRNWTTEEVNCLPYRINKTGKSRQYRITKCHFREAKDQLFC
ncbi:unnamed protein product [Brugia timori]|uniref:BPTI/Kunitz inhibitor domain-containing protein n=1 Tax=Brugia timori TaxID=42155 RepID=A0A0R3R2Z6_9BILA|nr:unnamed protein product [Brugia timori]